jgi:hypothetical protein
MVAIAYATDFKVNKRGKREIKRRFKSRREGSNVENPKRVGRRNRNRSKSKPTRPKISKKLSPSVKPRNSTCKARNKINTVLSQKVKQYK